MQGKPAGFTCYLCGGQFGSTSLKIHVAACQKKWVAVEAGKAPRDRRPLPEPPANLNLAALPTTAKEADALNASMFEYYDKVSLVPCPICARTFNPDAFEKHRKVCTPDKPGGPLGPGRNAPPPGKPAAAAAPGGSGGGFGGGKPSLSSGGGKPTLSSGGGGAGSPTGGAKSPAGGGGMSSKPRAYMCYLCGAQYGSSSLTIHIPQCYEKWLKVEAGKAPKERREPPLPPAELDNPLPTSSDEIDAFNSRMTSIYNGSSLTPCRNCGRTFRPEALAKHQNACTADNPMKAAGAGGNGLGGGGGGGRLAAVGGGSAGGMGDEQGGDEDLEECPNCHRRMRCDVMAKHSNICTKSKPMKSITRA